MKTFWSWQSDTPGKTGRHFVKKALEDAIDALQTEIEVDEPDRELHLDHDRKGVSGSPDLANTILEKIRATSIFIADVTPVGETQNGKLIINPNVAIELGYALAHVGDNSILMVLNNYYGDRESLPFDLKQKAGPIMYSLKPDATTTELRQTQSSLSGIFKTAIRECIKDLIEKNGINHSEHREIDSTDNSAIYFQGGESLVERGINSDKLRVAYDNSAPLLYLRIIPEMAIPPLKHREVKDIIYGIKISPFRESVGGGASWERNRFGGITFTYENGRDGDCLFTTSQIFLNREIWGIDATLLSGEKFIPSEGFEKLYESSLKHYLEVAENLLSLKPPFIIEAGATAVKDFTMAISNSYLGPIYDDEIKSRHRLLSLEDNDINSILLSIFDDFFDAVGEKRPNNFRGFPTTE